MVRPEKTGNREEMLAYQPYGPNGWLIRFADELGEEAFARGRRLTRQLEKMAIPELREQVVSFTRLLLVFDPSARDGGEHWVRELLAASKSPESPRAADEPIVEIPVEYNGEDLGRVADLAHLSTAEVCHRHSAPLYRVYLLGFAPGFPYLGPLDPLIHSPRLPSPRKRVKAGSVAIGGPHTGIYTLDTPGGWNIVGRTPLKIFDPARGRSDAKKAFLLHPGDRVRFVPE